MGKPGLFSASTLLSASGSRILSLPLERLDQASQRLADLASGLGLPTLLPQQRERLAAAQLPDPLLLAQADAQALRCAPHVVEASAVQPEALLKHADALKALRGLSDRAALLESDAGHARLVLSAVFQRVCEQMSSHLREVLHDDATLPGGRDALVEDIRAID